MIPSRARAALRALRDALVASLGRTEAGAQKTGHTDTEERTGQKPDATADPLHYESARAARLDTIDGDGDAQLLTTHDAQSANTNEPSDHDRANADTQLLDWAYNGRRLSEVGGRMVLPVAEDPRQQGDVDATATLGGDLMLSGEGIGAWIQSDYAVTLEGDC